MPKVTGNPVKITTSKAQYLFRVFHSPITRTDFRRFKGAYNANGDYIAPYQNTFSLNYNDHLFSIPATTPAIVDTANRLGYAEALLHINDEISCIVVWMVEEGKPIDKGSPTVVLNPWHSRELRMENSLIISGHEELMEEKPQQPFAFIPSYGFQVTGARGFKSFDLTTRDAQSYIYDPHTVLDVARETEKGKSRKQWFKNVLGYHDYYRDENDILHLTDFGSACLTRFPWFQATLETMQYTHSSFVVNPDGSIKPHTTAYTYRVANAAVDAAQMRRMHVLRTSVLQRVYEAWDNVVRYCNVTLHEIEMQGWPEYRNLPDVDGTGALALPYAYCQTNLVWRFISAIQWFLNCVAVACGSNSLASFMPYDGFYNQESYYKHVVNYLNGLQYDDVPRWEAIAEDEDSLSYETFGAMQDLVGAVVRRMYDYYRAGYHNSDGTVSSNALTAKGRALYSVMVHNAWASQYQATQGHLQSLFSLLFTWEFQFKPYEPTRQQAPSDGLKSRNTKKKIYNRFDRFEKAAAVGVEAFHMEGRVMEEKPRFTPPRSWVVTVPLPNADTLYSTEQRQAEIAAYQAKLAAIAAQREAERQDCLQRKQAQRQRMLDEIAAGKKHNPLDPWDHHNWRDKEWWVTPVAVDDVPAFISNALDTPSEIDMAGDIFNLSPRVQNGLKRLEPAINAVKDVVYPHRILRRGIRQTLVRRVIINGKTKYKKHALDEVKTNMKDRVYAAFDPNADQYTERDFWPDNEPAPSPSNPPLNPFRSDSEGFGGGESGGGGAGGGTCEVPY